MDQNGALSGAGRSISSTTKKKAEAASRSPQQQPDHDVEAMEPDAEWEIRPLSPDPPELEEALRRLAEAERITGDERAAAAARARPGDKRSVSELPAGWKWEWDDSVAMAKRYKCNYWDDPAYAGVLQDIGPLLARGAAVINYADRDP
uniref:Uncharacterized protein n=1 Tax=Oryza glumipatula TaxID=40148 RepID=A0A0E0AJV3_9ORYZ